MTRGARVRVHVTKEIRALWLPWLACLVVMAASVLGAVRWLDIGMLTYFFGTAALGALSIGHEYSHRTLGILLSQPARRAQLLLVKLGVLAVMLLTLCVVASVVLSTRSAALGHLGADPSWSWRMVAALWLPVLGGLFIAPWLTMLCRSPLAGTVFTIAIPGVFLTVGELAAVARIGFNPHTDTAFQFAMRGTLGLCAVAAVMGWRRFMRLEAIEGPGQDVRLPQWVRRRAPASDSARTKRHPVWLLVKKELRLQQMTLAVTGLYLLGWLVVTSLRSVVPGVMGIFFVLSVFYSGLVALLIGSLASAEERQLGTLDWQVLLPMAISTQCAVKVGVALGLTMLLAVGLPALLACLSPVTAVHSPNWPQEFVQPVFAANLIFLTSGSLYVSSLNTSGLRALLLSLPAMGGAALFLRILVESTGSAAHGALSRVFLAPGVAVGRMNSGVINVIALLLTAGLLGWFALANHRSSDRGAGRVWKQVAWMAEGLVLSLTLLELVSAFYQLAFLSRAR